MTQLDAQRHDPAAKPLTVSQRQREAVALMLSLAAERADAEERLTREHKSDMAVTERRLTDGREELTRKYRQAIDASKADYTARKGEIESTFTDSHGKATREFEAEKFRINERADHDMAAAKKGWEEARWAADTVFDAKGPQPAADYKKAASALKGKLAALKGLEDGAAEMFRRYKQRVPALEGSRTGLDPAWENESPADAQKRLNDLLAKSRSLSDRLRGTVAARLFEGMKPFFVFALPLIAAAALFGWQTNWQFDDMQLLSWFAGGAAIVGLLVLVGLYILARKQMTARYQPLLDTITQAKVVRERCLQHAADKRAKEEAALKKTRDEELSKAREKYEPHIDRVKALREQLLEEVDERFTRELDEIERRHDEQLAALEHEYAERTKAIESEHAETSAELEQNAESSLREIKRKHEDAWNDLRNRWLTGMGEVHDVVHDMTSLNARFPVWTDDIWHIWQPPNDFPPAIRFGELGVDIERMPGGLPKDARLLTGAEPLAFTLPASLDFPWNTSLLIETGEHGRETAVNALQNVMLRLLTSFPPGKVRFTIIDPVGLGQNFAAFMHLADYEEAFVSDRIWTETRHIEQRLTDLTEHMENVIQKYLRNDFQTITEYNEHAGEIAEPFRFLVVADFPVNFSDQAARRLVSIVDSGRRCGVYTLISMDNRLQMPQGFQPDDIRRGSGVYLIVKADGTVTWEDEVFGKLPLTLDEPPEPDFLTQTLHVVGESAKDSTRVEVPFEHVVPEPDKLWTFSSDREVTVPLGRAGATKLQHLSLGRGMAQHVLIAGKTGSGKSTLLHVLITNLALRFRPDEVEFYLVDFKKGVEFKTYATHGLPHARAVAIESDREFGLSVLQRCDAELKRRGELFRKLGVQDLAGYRGLQRDSADEDKHAAIPRTLLIIDEFQEFFVEDDRISQEAALLLDRLVRQGRAFGIHVLLGSQTLGGAYSLARATIGQMAVRIALQCSETDAMLIMGDDNTAPRLLSRPGEAIYNDQGGLVEGNNPFQIVWLPDSTREHYLDRVEELINATGYEPPEPQIVFEGNVAANVKRNQPLARALAGARSADTLPKAQHLWVGDAIAIKDPSAALFRRQSGTNLLIVGQREESALAMHALGLIAIAAQTPVATSRLYVFDSTPEDSPHAGHLRSIADRLPHDIRVVSWHEVEQAMAEIGEELERRQSANITDAPPLFTFIFGVQRFRQLRHQDEFGFSVSDTDKPKTPDKHLAEVLRDGPPYGMHTVVWCDNANNLSRTFDRNSLKEFDQRIVFQMSGADSSTLIDTPVASTLGENRALYFSEDLGALEKFRPYALPDTQFMSMVERAFADM